MLAAALALFLAPAALDPVDLMRKSAEAVKANSAKFRQYAFREYKVHYYVDKNGAQTGRTSETSDVVGLEGSTYRKLIMRNDGPLADKEQKREDERMEKEAARRKKETAAARRNRLVSFSYSFSFPYAKTADLYDLQYRGEETVNGRNTYLVEGTPKPGLGPSTPNEKEALNYRIKLWLDAEDHYFARVHLEVVGDHSRIQKGSVIHHEALRNEDAVWLPKLVSFRYSIRFFKMIGARGESISTYSDYHKFQVDSRVLDDIDK